MPRLNGLLVEHFLSMLTDIAKTWASVWVIDCLNYSTMYPQFFDHVDRDPAVYYIFVVRGNFSAVPDKRRGDKPFRTTCPGVENVAEDNVMVVSVCSTYLYSARLEKNPPMLIHLQSR